MIDRQALLALRGKNVHVVGLASTECAAMVRYLASQGIGPLTVHDFTPADRLPAAFSRFHVGMDRAERDRVWAEIASLDLQLRTGERYLEGIGEAEAIVVGQAWYLYAPNLPILAELKASGLPFIGLAELYFGLSPAPILAVTGSNGKSTTSRLIEAMLRQTPQTIYYAGNERRSVQVLDQMDRMKADDWLVLEVSNRQLIDLEPRPRIAVVTNVLPNHLDEHGGTLEAYTAVKRKLVALQGPDDEAVLNADNAIARGFAREIRSCVSWFSTAGAVERGAWLDNGLIWLKTDDRPARDLGPLTLSRLVGEHNRQNILAAVAAAALAGADDEAIRKGLAAFRGLNHRLQLVYAANGVEYFDDLNSTTPQATVAALNALGDRVILIVGGDDKGLALDELATAVRDRVRLLVALPGAGAQRITAAVAELSRPGGTAAEQMAGPTEVVEVSDLAAALDLVMARAEPGDRVLLSPACPNFFRHFYVSAADEEQGFRRLLRARLADPQHPSQPRSETTWTNPI